MAALSFSEAPMAGRQQRSAALWRHGNISQRRLAAGVAMTVSLGV